MYNKKYQLITIEELNGCYNPIHEKIKGKICFSAHFNVGKIGWFMCDINDMFNSVYRIHTSEVTDVEYTADNRIIVTTVNTRYVFVLMTE